MRKGIGLLAIAFGAVTCGAAQGLLAPDFLWIDASSGVATAIGAFSIVVGLALLARDHRGSDVLGAMLLLTFSALIGWVTFYGPEGLIGTKLSFLPENVADSLGRLLFGFGIVASGVMAFLGLKRLLG